MVVCGCVCMRTGSFSYGGDSFLLETTVESSGGELWLSGDPFFPKNPSNTPCLNLQEHESETSDPGDNVSLVTADVVRGFSALWHWLRTHTHVLSKCSLS